MSAPASPIDAHRREARRLAWVDRLLMVIGFGFIGWVCYAIFVADRRDVFYMLPSLVGTLTGLARYLVHRARAVPQVVWLLANGDAAARDAAWHELSQHRAELLLATTLSATIHEAPLAELERDALVARIARAGPIDWRRVLRRFLVVWIPVMLATFIATLVYTPAPTHDY